MHFKIIIPLYNVEQWIKTNIQSVKSQSHKDFQCILIDDISTDNSASVIKKEILNDDRFVLIENTDKALALKNIYDGINFSQPGEEDVIVTLDGDDWLAHEHVLKILKQTYEMHNCWVTYGSYVEYPSRRKGQWATQIPKHIIDNNSYRHHRWCASHLRSFKHHLWNKIKKEDLLDSSGNFYRMTWDLAFMFPMLEMAGHRSHHIADILYVYNMSNPLNDHKMDNIYQVSLEKEIRNKKKYSKVERGEGPA